MPGKSTISAGSALSYCAERFGSAEGRKDVCVSGGERERERRRQWTGQAASRNSRAVSAAHLTPLLVLKPAPLLSLSREGGAIFLCTPARVALC